MCVRECVSVRCTGAALVERSEHTCHLLSIGSNQDGVVDEASAPGDAG